jgi:hypothetical protein
MPGEFGKPDQEATFGSLCAGLRGHDHLWHPCLLPSLEGILDNIREVRPL